MTAEPVHLFDLNVLVALAVPAHVSHVETRRWVTSRTGPWATCPTTESGLVRLLLQPAVTGRETSPQEVLGVLAALRAAPGHTFLTEDRGLGEPLVDLAALRGHRQVTDLHLINVAMSHAAVLVTLDHRLVASLTAQDRRHVVLVGS